MVLGLNVFFSHKTFVHNKTKITINILFLSDTHTFYAIVVQYFNNVFTDFSKVTALDTANNAQIAMYTVDYYRNCFSILVFNKILYPLSISMLLWYGNEKIRYLLSNHNLSYRM